MKIKKIQIKNFLGIDEFGIDTGKINVFKGAKGTGKSSIIEAIEKTFANKDRRTEVVKHGENEATLFIETDNGIEIDRRIRTEKADYLKIRKGEEGVPNTEKFLRSLIKGDIFRPVDWINMDEKEQAKSILNMLQINWNQDDIFNWFGEITSNIDFSQHILVVLKAIEAKYFKDREEVNRQIKELKTQINVILKELPADYDGEVWREKKIQEYYNKVSEAQKINSLIDTAKALQENFEDKISKIKANAENDKSRVQMKYKDQRQDVKDVIDLSRQRIDKAKEKINGLEPMLNLGIKSIDDDEIKAVNDLEKELQAKIEELNTEYRDRISTVKAKADEKRTGFKDDMQNEKLKEKDAIQAQENKITQKTEELNSLDALEKQELETVDFKLESEIKHENLKLGEAAKYIESYTEVEVEPLQQEADQVAEMQSYLRQWDMMIDIRDNKLVSKERDSAVLTERIAKARTMPSELLKTAHMPIDGISVDEKGLIRINGTLIGSLSDGEKLELAMKIAKAQAGELKVICVDRWESLDKKSQDLLLKDMENDNFQYFITQVFDTESGEMEVEKDVKLH